MTIAWHAIVRNEAAVLPRCVASLMPHIDCAVVVDTGSTDGTPDLLTQLFAEAGKSIEIAHAPFVNFGQTRNDALEIARKSPLSFDYMLLSDADMELRVHTPDWINGHRGHAYDLRQTAGTVSYYNRRLLHRQAPAAYKGVTHEFLAVPADGILHGAEFVDHADGANRPEKFKRDIDLLTSALQTETDPGLVQRYEFYLAQSYFDMGDWANAAIHYQKRTTLGGYAEEVWNAQLHYAHCLGNDGRHAEFLHELLKAYELRPHRAETLYDLAKYYRERGENHTSLLFSEAGMRTPYPKDDQLFVNDFVYSAGCRDEFAITAYYDPARRTRGAQICNALALDRAIPAGTRAQARANLYWYLQPLAQHVPSFRPVQLCLNAPEPYVFCNPSVVNWRGRPVAVLRAVNYRIGPSGQYDTGGDSAIRTRNFLIDVDHAAETEILTELTLPENWPASPAYDQVRGLEDCRLFEWDEQLWVSATARELNREGMCEMVLAPVSSDGIGGAWRRMLPKERTHEKNWMPFVRAGSLEFVYRLGALVNSYGDPVLRHHCAMVVEHLSGSSQVIQAQGHYLALVHEAGTIPGKPNRYYSHRFVRLGPTGAVLGVSPPFVFTGRQIEFAAGLAYFPAKRQLLASYGVMDREAWLAWMNLDEVLAFIDQGAQ